MNLKILSKIKKLFNKTKISKYNSFVVFLFYLIGSLLLNGALVFSYYCNIWKNFWGGLFIASFIDLGFIFFLWLIFLKYKPSNEEKSHDSSLNTLKSYWFWILGIGLWGILAKHWLNYYQDTVSKKSPWNLYDYLLNFLDNDIFQVFSVVMGTMLASFVIIFFNELFKLHENIDKIKKGFKATIKQTVNANTESKNLVENLKLELVNINNIQTNLFKLVSASKSENEFFNNSGEKDITRTEYIDSVNSIREKVSLAFNKYFIIDNEKPQHRESQKIIATTFIKNFLSNFVQSKYLNKVQANFGIMSKIVSDLYLKMENFTKNSEGKKVVYFTTLTMNPHSYLSPKEFAGNTQSAIDLWNKYIKETKATEKKDNKSKEIEKIVEPTHIDKMIQLDDSLSFERICLWHNEKDILTDISGLLVKSHWFDPSIEYIKEFIRDMKNYFNDEDVNRIKLKLIDRENNLQKLNENQNQKVIQKFIEIFHPKTENCKYREINCPFLEKFFTEKFKLSEINTLKLDSHWKNLIEMFYISNDKKSISNNSEAKIREFYNNHIPIDIFAIGIQENKKPVNWIGCLSGYIGGDLFSMTLGWHDDFIAPEEWNIIKKYIDYLRKDAQVLDDEVIEAALNGQ